MVGNGKVSVGRYILFFLCIVSGLRSYPQNNFCSVSNNCIRAGEKLTFKVYYNLSAVWIPAGEAVFNTTLTQLNGFPVYHITGDGRTYSSYDWIFKVRDRYETFLDTQTLMPRKFVRNVNEGGYRIYNNVVFHQEQQKAHSNGKTFDVPRCVQDVLSAIYYARNINYNQYKPGAKIPFSMFLDDEVHHLYIRYGGKAKIKTKYGVFNAIKITPLLIKGTIFEGGENMVVWVSDDANHIPLRIDSPILVGSIKVDMMGYSQLRHPLTSLLKRL